MSSLTASPPAPPDQRPRTPLEGVWWRVGLGTPAEEMSQSAQVRIRLRALVEDTGRTWTGVRHTPWGAPVLQDAPVHDGAARPGDPAHVSLTHSGEYLGVALSERHRVGLDLECAPHAFDSPALLRRACPEATHRQLLTLPPWLRHAVARHVWTATEARLKALGTGLRRDPRTLAPMPLAAVIRGVVEGDLEHGTFSCCLALLTDDGHAATLHYLDPHGEVLLTINVPEAPDSPEPATPAAPREGLPR